MLGFQVGGRPSEALKRKEEDLDIGMYTNNSVQLERWLRRDGKRLAVVVVVRGHSYVVPEDNGRAKLWQCCIQNASANKSHTDKHSPCVCGFLLRWPGC